MLFNVLILVYMVFSVLLCQVVYYCHDLLYVSVCSYLRELSYTPTNFNTVNIQEYAL
jgi:hypothetical protein